MILITQLIYIHPGSEAIFDEFESHAIPIISKYGGKLLLRTKVDKNNVIEGSMETPYEIHLVSFDHQNQIDDFFRDEERKKWVHLKEASIREVWLIKGEKM